MTTDDYAADFERRASEALPHFGSPELRPIQLAETYARLAALAVARAEFYGRLLERAYAADGMDALIGEKMDALVIPGGREFPATVHSYGREEAVRALVALEAQERDRAERLAREAIKMGIEASRVDVMRSYARTVAETAKAMALELGADWADVSVRRAAQRAVLTARQRLGFDQRSPDEVGARLTEEERARVLLPRGEFGGAT
jgi:hypothetical protein